MLLVGDISKIKSKHNYKLDFYENKIILANLEGPILEPNKIKSNLVKNNIKAGPCIYSEYNSTLFKKYKFILSCANNHIYDFGEEELYNTLKILKKNKKKYFGVGRSFNEAIKPIIIKNTGYKIGLISACESQFGIAQLSKSGAAPLGHWIYDTILKLKKNCDFVILSIHKANEDWPLPSPKTQELYRSFIDVGADIIHGHHSHVIQGFETYKNKLIIYGCGNFIVDYDSWKDYKNGLCSVGFEIKFLKEYNFEYNVHFFKIEKRDNTIFIKKNQSNTLIEYINFLNEIINNSQKLSKVWQEMSLIMYNEFYKKYILDSISLDIKTKVKRGKINFFKKNIDFNVSKNINNHTLIYHLFSCESHTEAIQTALGILCGEIKDIRDEESKNIIDKIKKFASE